MTRHLLLPLVVVGCATPGPAPEVRRVELSLEERARLDALRLPRLEAPEAIPPEVDELLARPLSAEAAVRVALLANPDTRAALAEVGVARGQLVQAGLLPNPELDLELRGPGGPQPAQLDIGLELSVSQTLLAPLRASVAEANLDAERLRATGLLLDLAWQTRVAFFELQALQQKLELRLGVLKSQQASYATAVELAKAGNLPAVELASELAAVELARVQVAEAENAMLDAREALTRRLGLSGARAGFTLAGPLPLPAEDQDLADAEVRAVTASLELLEFQRRAEGASRKLRLAQTEGALPHLTAGFHGERDGDLWELGAHVGVGLPVFDRQQGRQLSAQSEYEALRARAEAAAVNLRSTVRQTSNRVESAGRRARHYAQRLVPARKRQLDETLLQYNAMTVGVFQLLQVQRGVTEALVAQVDATLDYWRARASFDLLMAGRSTPLRALAALPASSAAPSMDPAGH
ncbi:MAG: TolC family protein [Myxococcaceae bacterium]|nr:TolC family protein [Myxococcaceae bacterium]